MVAPGVRATGCELRAVELRRGERLLLAASFWAAEVERTVLLDSGPCRYGPGRGCRARSGEGKGASAVVGGGSRSGGCPSVVVTRAARKGATDRGSTAALDPDPHPFPFPIDRSSTRCRPHPGSLSCRTWSASTRRRRVGRLLALPSPSHSPGADCAPLLRALRSDPPDPPPPQPSPSRRSRP